MSIFNQEILFGFTLRHIIIALLVLWIVSGVIKKAYGEKGGRKLMKKRCRGCSWTGPAGKSTTRCPKCRGPLIGAE